MVCETCGWSCMTCNTEFCCPRCGSILIDEREIKPIEDKSDGNINETEGRRRILGGLS